MLSKSAIPRAHLRRASSSGMLCPPMATLRATRTTAKSASGTSRNIKVIMSPRVHQAGVRRAYSDEDKVVWRAKLRSFATTLPSRRMSSRTAASGDSNAPSFVLNLICVYKRGSGKRQQDDEPGKVVLPAPFTPAMSTA